MWGLAPCQNEGSPFTRRRSHIPTKSTTCAAPRRTSQSEARHSHGGRTCGCFPSVCATDQTIHPKPAT